MRRLWLWAVSGFLVLSCAGCFAIIAGGAAGGTAYWLSGKLSQTMDASFESTVDGARDALKAMDLSIDSEMIKKDVAQFKSKWTDGSEIWVDIKPVTTGTTQVDVRVGATSRNKAAASDIMKKIEARV